MNYKGLKLNIIVLVIGLVVIAYFAGQHLLEVYNVNKPLQEKLLAVDQVKDLNIVSNQGKTDIEVSLNPVIDFYHVYKDIESIASDQLGNELGAIKIINDSDRELEDIYYQLHYAIFEGLATHRFVAMKDNVAEVAAENNLKDYQLWVDQNAVYLQLTLNGHSLFHRIPYQRTVTIKTEGGGTNG